ncbi:MAG: AEC family transporter [Ruminococcus sp.]|nr:AEC family transporter [Ruminococcus sp.]
MSATIFRQTIIMLILIFTGVLCAKTKIIGKEANRDLSKFVLQVINPVVIFMAYQSEYRPELAKNLLVTFGLSLLSFVIMITLAYVFVRKKEKRETEIERFSLIYSNCGFMGIPLVSALFGDEGVFYLTAFITVFNIFVWTHGIILISGEKSMKNIVKVLRSPTIISIALGLICFFARIKLPEVPAQALTFIKEINTPMAMIVSGVTMADTDVFKLVKNLRVYIICALRLLVIPLAVVGVLSVFDIDSKVRLTIIAASAAPPAAMCTLHCIRYGKNSVYSSEIFTAGTILSVLTLPLIVKIAELL